MWVEFTINCVDDVAVIDEAQMIQNNERGFAWTRVILGKLTIFSNLLFTCTVGAEFWQRIF